MAAATMDGETPAFKYAAPSASIAFTRSQASIAIISTLSFPVFLLNVPANPGPSSSRKYPVAPLMKLLRSLPLISFFFKSAICLNRSFWVCKLFSFALFPSACTLLSLCCSITIFLITSNSSASKFNDVFIISNDLISCSS